MLVSAASFDDSAARLCAPVADEEALRGGGLQDGPRATAASRETTRRSHAAPLADGVGVVVRVRPFSTVERADPSTRNCVQCLKDCVVISAESTGSGGSGVAAGRSSVGVSRVSAGSPLSGQVVNKISNNNSNSGRVCGSDAKAAARCAPAASCTARPQQFSVDRTFHALSSQIEVYEQCCRSIVEGVLHGVNGSILAYGATGSGKTHTMFGSTMSAAGIVYQSVQDIFAEKDRLEEEDSSKHVTVRCNFVEIYNEEVFDLLAAASASQGPLHPQQQQQQQRRRRTALQVREVAKEDRECQINPESLVICGLHSEYPESVEEFARLIQTGQANRFVAATSANAQSSRSHAIITVEVTVADSSGREGTVARVRFCDLAGSERAAASSNSGMRLREGGNINRSLLALGAVVQSLVQQRRHPERRVFVPYRGSKLTRLLRDGIGGNCCTLMIFCLSPGARQYEDSVNTMLFAAQAKEIRVAARRNEYSVNSTQLKKSQELIIDELRAELAAARDELLRLGAAPPPAISLTDVLAVDPCARSHAAGSSALVASSSVTRGGAGLTHASASLSVSALSSMTSATPYSSAAPTSVQALPAPSAVSLLSQLDGVTGAASDVKVLPLPIPYSLAAARSPVRCEPASAIAAAANTSRSPARATGLLASSTRSVRPSVFQEGSPMFTELEGKLKTFSAEKEALYHQMRDAQEQQHDRDIKLRELKWRLARFLANKAVSGGCAVLAGGSTANDDDDANRGSNGDGDAAATASTPVGVAGLLQMIAAMEADGETREEALSALTDKLDSLDRQLADTHKELLCERQQASLELLLDNAKLRQNCTEAECLAAHYHQECRTILNREEEYAQALETCVGVIRTCLTHLPAAAPLREQARLALTYAQLPTARTQDMISVFEHSLRASAEPPPLPPMVPVGTPHHPPPTPSSSNAAIIADARRGDDGSGSNRADDGDLQQHYRELLEVACTLRAASPHGARGLRLHTPTRSLDAGAGGADDDAARSLCDALNSADGRSGGAPAAAALPFSRSYSTSSLVERRPPRAAAEPKTPAAHETTFSARAATAKSASAPLPFSRSNTACALRVGAGAGGKPKTALETFRRIRTDTAMSLPGSARHAASPPRCAAPQLPSARAKRRTKKEKSAAATGTASKQASSPNTTRRTPTTPLPKGARAQPLVRMNAAAQLRAMQAVTPNPRSRNPPSPHAGSPAPKARQ